MWSAMVCKSIPDNAMVASGLNLGPEMEGPGESAGKFTPASKGARRLSRVAGERPGVIAQGNNQDLTGAVSELLRAQARKTEVAAAAVERAGNVQSLDNYIKVAANCELPEELRAAASNKIKQLMGL